MLRRPALATLLVLTAAIPPVNAGDVQTDGKLVSGATEGPPLEVQSTDRVDNLNAQFLDGLSASDVALAGHFHAGSEFTNVVVVSAEGGDFPSIQDAIDSIMDASAENPYLVWIGPGIYEEAVTTKTGVHLQGAGQDVTVVRGSFHTSSDLTSNGLVTVVDDSGVRDLTIENEVEGAVGNPVLGFALVIQGSSGRLEDLTVRSSMTCDDPDTSFRAQAAKVNAGAPRLSRVTLEAEMTGTEADGFCNAVAFSADVEATPDLEDSRFVATGRAPLGAQSIAIAVQVTGTSAVTIRDAVLSATGGTSSAKAFNLPGSMAVARVAHSQVIGGVGGFGTAVCFGAYDEALAGLGPDCQAPP